jgi:hypothetical protein
LIGPSGECGGSTLLGVSPSFASVVGLQLQGRLAKTGDEIVIDTQLAKRCFGSEESAAVLGRSLEHDGTPRTVVGVHEPIDISFGRGESLGAALTLFGRNFNSQLILPSEETFDRRSESTQAVALKTRLELALSEARGRSIRLNTVPVAGVIEKNLRTSVILARAVLLAWALLALFASVAFVLHALQQLAQIQPAVALQSALGALPNNLLRQQWKSLLGLSLSMPLIVLIAWLLKSLDAPYVVSATAVFCLSLLWLARRLVSLQRATSLQQLLR